MKFKERVLRVVEEIPKGRVMSYKEVAIKAGRPKAYRAVGNILNRNHSFQIPCHRVIKSDGTIGGYNKGVEKKIAVLKKEGVKVKVRK